jgi:hypothetical protein
VLKPDKRGGRKIVAHGNRLKRAFKPPVNIDNDESFDRGMTPIANDSVQVQDVVGRRKRGRPKRHAIANDQANDNRNDQAQDVSIDIESRIAEPEARRSQVNDRSVANRVETEDVVNRPKRKRGRPRKQVPKDNRHVENNRNNSRTNHNDVNSVNESQEEVADDEENSQVAYEQPSYWLDDDYLALLDEADNDDAAYVPTRYEQQQVQQQNETTEARPKRNRHSPDRLMY